MVLFHQKFFNKKTFFCLFYFLPFYPSDNHFVFLQEPEQIATIEGSLYQSCVKLLPICCVDIFVYNTFNATYLLIQRLNPPAKNMFWFPGGRIYKGESFFDAAQRKCKEEINLEVLPISIIDVYTTIFPDSAWDCQTHTVNVAILCTCQVNTSTPLVFNNDHGDYKWRSIAEAPDHVYLNDIYNKVGRYLHSIKALDGKDFE